MCHPNGRRIIPARAGFTLSLRLVGAWAGGSSPLARGLHACLMSTKPNPGIIPARAGFTDPAVRRAVSPRDHPRSRGVYTPLIHRLYEDAGSSPLARGLPRPLLSGGRSAGIIPARAGFTNIVNAELKTIMDHPRSRGVYPPPLRGSCHIDGSSPLARGLRRHRQVRLHAPGIIPARAGFTHGPACAPPTSWDHPRSRGVYQGSASHQWPALGSSPLARGLRPRRPALLLAGRIIPARAGFTYQWVEDNTLGSDHPRSRGVYVNAVRNVITTVGSSPLARGLPRLDRGRHRPRRIIPARAGFTRLCQEGLP